MAKPVQWQRFGADGGWFRVFGFGLTWKPVTARRYFSERNGYVRWFAVGRWRVRFLTPRT